MLDRAFKVFHESIPHSPTKPRPADLKGPGTSHIRSNDLYGRLRICQTQRWRVKGQPVVFPYKFRYFCESCGAGSGMVWCPTCDGEGYYITAPGKAGHPYKQGTARCKSCNGIGVVPCPLCGGQEVRLRPPNPDQGPPDQDSSLSVYEWLGHFSEGRH